MTAGRHLIVEIPFGKLRGRRRVLAAGTRITAGRTDRADVVIAHDKLMSGVHFELSWDGDACQLRDKNSRRGTLLDGEPVTSAPVEHGSWIRAGGTDFMVYRELDTPGPDDGHHFPEEREQQDAALATLREHVGQLYAVVDASRGTRVLELLNESIDAHKSLYEGPDASSLADVAPYLVRIHAGSELLARLVTEGWGRRWGIYLTSTKKFPDVRRHLRRFLMVRQEESAKQLYFRYYDPATLRTFLSVITPRQESQFYAQVIDRFIFEEPLERHCSFATEPDGSTVIVTAGAR